uniref:Ribosomal protein S7 n=1 Tax=Nitzschia sp. PL1-4 TaxID=2083272 RepID=A0A2Z5ZA83_9STRA|nr:ribosomal protein S7 [Nitzschia sp. PL1-4]
MSRKRYLKEEFIKPDSIYNNFLISLFISKILKSGKKVLANNIVYETCSILKKHFKEDPINIIKEAIKLASPKIELKDKKIRNSIKKIPVEISSYRATYLALKWIIKYSKKRTEKTMSKRLANEILEIVTKNNSRTIKEKRRFHKIAKSNKSFTYHFKR